MYSLEEVNQSLENEKISTSLYKLERFATSQGLTELANWSSNELNGYSNSKVKDEEKDIIEKYRYVPVDWKNVWGRTVVIPPEFVFLHKLTVWQGVIELEGYESEGFSLVIQQLIDAVNKISSVKVSKATISPEQTKSLFERIRIQARKNLHDYLPRVSTKKVVYPAPNFAKLVSDVDLVRVLSNRWTEANLTFEAGAYLSTVILLGSILEGVLLDKVEQNPAQASSSPKSPKDKSGKPLPFKVWKLQSLIEVCHDCGWLKKEYKDFSHVVRDYRNFIHPNKERQEGITFSESICKVIWEVVSASLN